MLPDQENPEIQDLRQEYTNRPIDVSTVPAHPVVLFETWFTEAQSARLVEPNAMSLATATPGGAISCRTVLLKAYDKGGFVFFTNYESEKSRQIATNPNVACLFPWLPLSRQVEVTGVAEKIPTAESLAYFIKRPFKSQIGAWVSAQSSVISSRQILEAKFAELCKKFADGRVPLPSAWGGYRVVPHTIEFWQGGRHRLHDRIQYTRTPAATWEITRLSP